MEEASKPAELDPTEELPHIAEDDELAPLIRDLSEDKQIEIRRFVAMRVSSFQGPIPRPEHFAQYERTLPGTAERILRMAEKEQDHRHEESQRDYALKNKGLWVGSILILLLIALLAYGIYTRVWQPVAAIASVIITIALVFVLRKSPRQNT